MQHSVTRVAPWACLRHELGYRTPGRTIGITAWLTRLEGSLLAQIFVQLAILEYHGHTPLSRFSASFPFRVSDPGYRSPIACTTIRSNGHSHHHGCIPVLHFSASFPFRLSHAVIPMVRPGVRGTGLLNGYIRTVPVFCPRSFIGPN